MLPVMDTLKGKADIQVKFVNYAMHGEKELQENMRQYCIETQVADKYSAYLKCFLAAGDAAGCVKSTGVDGTKLATCMTATDSKYKIMDVFNDPAKPGWRGQFPPFPIYEAENQKYGVQGSPTLIINGVEANAGRDSASLLAAVCNAFTTKPKECSTQLSGDSPSPGFGFAAAAAGSANTAAGGCATA
jgi:hypothetical protein